MTKFNTQDLCGRLDEKRGYNMNTCSGLPVWPKDPRPEDIRIEDIAGALSRLCRYNGHLRDELIFDYSGGLHNYSAYKMPVEIYSVAQHSVLVEEKVRNQIFRKYTIEPERISELRLAALLHDASEYVLGDMIKPQKRMYDHRKEYETAWDRAIAERFGFDPELFKHPAIKEADYRMFLTEKRDVVNTLTTDFGVAKAKPYTDRVIPLLPSQARRMFMDRFNELYKGE